MASSQQSNLAPARQIGEAAEDAVVLLDAGLRYVPDEAAVHYDAVVEDLMEPSERLPFVGLLVLEVGTVVEIKSTIPRYPARRGRFQIRRAQHEALLEEAGVYLFAVCAPTDARDVIAGKVVPASTVDQEIVAEATWVSAGPGREDYCQFSWTRVFAPEEVQG